ncbi:hypothetical protein [Bradyrhizobium tropiciagri]|uniref:hypothetical protein n=1 Tax=Bradyrhizobium tropiciagri TaxID=312253 RepID=UPI0012FEA241|nr:hypothetical protein [Bradyrhizobium tropiciagri]
MRFALTQAATIDFRRSISSGAHLLRRIRFNHLPIDREDQLPDDPPGTATLDEY